MWLKRTPALLFRRVPFFFVVWHKPTPQQGTNKGREHPLGGFNPQLAFSQSAHPACSHPFPINARAARLSNFVEVPPIGYRIGPSPDHRTRRLLGLRKKGIRGLPEDKCFETDLRPEKTYDTSSD